MNNLSDVMSGANLYGGSNYYFAPDRFGLPSSAVYFNQGFLQVPSGIYFSGEFTFTAWIYLVKCQDWSRIIDFGNGQGIDNVLLTFYQSTSQIQGSVNQGSANAYFKTSSIINLNQWYFVSFVLSNKIGYIYVNGNQFASGTLLIPNKINTTKNYIGKSNWANDLYAEAVYDDIKIYSGALSPNDIINKYNLESKNISKC
jgi:hypothetical protein